MSSLMETRYVATSIQRSPEDVYRFASDPRNVTAWAAGLAGRIEPAGDEWLADSPLGKVRIRFTPSNPHGVLDHDVTIESGVTFHNPMRVMPNGSGSEVVFVLFRRPDVSDAEFEADARAIARDLETLKRLLEAPAGMPR
jgi:hypothetical protein